MCRWCVDRRIGQRVGRRVDGIVFVTIPGDGAYPPFTEFAAFVKECAEKANIPEPEDLTRTRETVKASDHTRRSIKDKEVNPLLLKDLNKPRTRTCRVKARKKILKPVCLQGTLSSIQV